MENPGESSMGLDAAATRQEQAGDQHREQPNTIGRIRLQLEIDNAIAELDLPEQESERLAGILCARVKRWVNQVHQADCQSRKILPSRPKSDSLPGS